MFPAGAGMRLFIRLDEMCQLVFGDGFFEMIDYSNSQLMGKFVIAKFGPQIEKQAGKF
jgi:hypothetical protein